ncbi:hypothetical protein THRCLA_07435 [Thraustotheca clavata]|uniref:Uncharacterized protein n=1 Tax=Thraustotheca clavata TaxID=74557 RepID=A0A1V9ZDD5_9STRA|nr:hypothetical protein THRCLA_07435 [Thraustotheca clavata]
MARSKRDTKKQRSGSVEKSVKEGNPVQMEGLKLYAQILLDTPQLKVFGDETKAQWYAKTKWTEDMEAAVNAIVLLELDIYSNLQLNAVKTYLDEMVLEIELMDVGCRLQVENSSNCDGKCLKLTMQFSDKLKIYLAKMGNLMQLKLQSLGIKSFNRFDRNKKAPRDVTLWSLDESNAIKSLQNDIQDFNRQRVTLPLHLSTLVLSSHQSPKTENTLSIWRKHHTAPTNNTYIDTLRSQLSILMSFKGKEVVILRGLPGSGKSTISRLVQKMAIEQGVSTVLCSADTYFESPSGYYHERSKLTEAHELCKSTFSRAISNNIDVIVVDNTHSMLWEYESYMQDAMSSGYSVRIAEVACSDAAMAQRMMYRNSHGVGMDVIMRMFLRWEAHVPTENVFHLIVLPNFYAIDNQLALPLLLHDTNEVYIAAVFLTEESKKNLFARFPPKHKQVVGEHMTLSYLPTPDFINELDIGQHCRLRVLKEFSDNKGHCVYVEWEGTEVPCQGQRILHITLSFAPDASAVYSNSLLVDPNAAIVDVANEGIVIEGVIGLALRPRSGPRGIKPQLLNLPQGGAKYVGQQLIVVHAPSSPLAIDTLLNSVLRVAKHDSILVYIGEPELLAHFSANSVKFELCRHFPGIPGKH